MKARFPGFSAIRGVFSNRNYAIYMSGNSISLVGFWVQRLGVGWLTWELTGSGFWLGFIAFADLFPVVVIGPFAGVLADRVDRRRLMQVCQTLGLLQAAVLALLTAVDAITIEALLGLTLFLGVTTAANQPARLSLVPSLVRPADLSTAVALNAVIFNTARFVGPAVAGVVIAGFGVAWAFAFNAVSYAVLVVVLGFLRLPPRQRPPSGASGVLADIGEGVRYAVRHPAIGPLLLLMTAVSLLARPVFELLPGFVDTVFGLGAGGLAALTSAVGLGAIAGGVWLAQRGTLAGLTRIVLASAAVSGLVLVAFSGTALFWLALAAMAAAGAATVMCSIGIQTLIQTTVAGHMRGRVLSLWGIIIRAGPALGALAMGWSSGYLGLGWPVAAGGALCTLAAAIAWSRRSRLAALLEEPADGKS